MKTKNKKVFILFFLFSLSFFYKTKASDYYWVGGTGNWSDYSNHWATTSGGLIFHIQTPGPFDDVFFDVNSFIAAGQTITVDSTLIYCNNMDWTGAINSPTLSFSSGSTLKIYGSLTLAANMAFGTNNNGGIVFESTSPGKTITSAGVDIKASISFSGVGGDWSLNDALEVTNSSGNIGIYNGSFYTNNFPVECQSFYLYTTGTIDLGSSVINCGSFNDYGFPTLIAAAATINCGSFYGYPGRTYHDVNCVGTLQSSGAAFNDVSCARIEGFPGGNVFHNVLFSGVNMHIDSPTNTFHKATFVNGDVMIGGNCSFDSLLFNNPGYSITLYSGTTQTVNDAMVANGSCTSWISLHSSTLGAQATISKISGTVTVSYLLLTDINATGGASFTANSSLNMGNVTGWTINAPAAQNLYWVGGTGNWDDANHWSTSSGGTGGACLPSPYDNIFFDANSFSSAGQIVSLNVSEAYCNNMDWTGAINSPTLSFSSGSIIKIYGSLTLAANMAFGTNNNGGIVFESTSPGKTITSAGVNIKASISFSGVGGDWSLNDALEVTGAIGIYNGSFYTNNFPFECQESFYLYTTGTIDLGSSVINCGSFNDYGFPTLIAAPTINCGSFYGYSGRTYHDVNCVGTLQSSGAAFNDVSCARIEGFPGGNVFHNVLFSGVNMHIDSPTNTFHKATFVNGDVMIGGNCSFDSLLFNNPGYSITLYSGTTQTVNDAMVANGSCTSWISLHSSTLGAQATISKISGTVTVSYLLLTDINATGGASFTANSSLNMGNVTGWTINAPAAQNLYWVGGTGNWDDANHWSTSSGGTGGACLPSPYDNIFFDANSFSSAGQIVSLNVSEAYCNNMDWTGAINSPTLSFSSGSTLKIYGSLTLAANMAFGTNNNGGIVFESTSPGKTITSAGVNIKASISFSGVGGDWSLNDAFEVTGAIGIYNGSFYTNNFPFECQESFYLYTTGTIDLGSSVINCGSFNDYGFPTLIAAPTINCVSFYGYPGRTYHDVNCVGTLQCSGAVFNDVSCARIEGFPGGNVFHNVLFSGVNMHIDSPTNTFHKATFVNGDVIIGGNCSFDSLLFDNPGYTVTLYSFYTQTINIDLSANSLPGFPIQITGGTISKAAGQVCLNYILLQNCSATGGAQFFAGSNSVDLGGNSGWLFSNCAPYFTNVWPGDANYDLVADNLDILNLGIAYGNTGTTRIGANLSWTAQPSQTWLTQFITGANLNNADCDGNGIVNAADTLAVSLNYGLTHPFRLSSNENTTSTGTDLYFDMPTGNLVPGSNVSIPVNFGTTSNPANNVYGIAFTINYDPAFIQAGSMYMDYTGSWLATPSNYIHLEKDFSITGNFDMGVCRTNHQNVSGSGLIATLHFTVANNASGLLTLSFNGVLAISNNEIPIPVNPQDGSVPTGIDELAENGGFSLYPNPVKDYLYFGENNTSVNRVEIYNCLGQQVADIIADSKKIFLGNLSEGMYLLYVFDKDMQKVFIKKFIKD